MKLNLKRITSSFILALTLVSSHVTFASSEELGDTSKKRKHSETFALQDGSEECTKVAKTTSQSEWGKLEIGGLDRNILQNIFRDASDNGTSPIVLASVCASWRYAMRENSPMNTNLNYHTLNVFMKNCMHRYWAHPIRNMQLIHTDPKTDEKTVMKIPAGADPLNFVFESKNPDIFRHVRITTSVAEFFKINRENENKLVILASTHGLIQRLSAAEFSNIGKWDPVVAPVGLFWRWGNWENSSWYDYLVTSSACDLSDVNLIENWSKGVTGSSGVCVRMSMCASGVAIGGVGQRPDERFHVSFLNSPKNN